MCVGMAWNESSRLTLSSPGYFLPVYNRYCVMYIHLIQPLPSVLSICIVCNLLLFSFLPTIIQEFSFDREHQNPAQLHSSSLNIAH